MSDDEMGADVVFKSIFEEPCRELFCERFGELELILDEFNPLREDTAPLSGRLAKEMRALRWARTWFGIWPFEVPGV